jgi:radical SAM superfamily enzyme YgiQ (UPF0313 family)
VRHEPWIVGLTSLVSNVKRAFELADAFREVGCTIVMGGPQTSVDPLSSLEHADAIVIGEAEGVWGKLLDDWLAGRLERTYRSKEPCDFSSSPRPRWDLVDEGRILTYGVQAPRRCRFHCDFCLVRTLFGAKQRYRGVDDVLREIRDLPPGVVAFADDNLTADRSFARELMRGMEPLGRQWSCQASVDLASDEELVRAMARAGCNSVLIGFETLDEHNLKQMHKSQNRIDRYRSAIELFHSAGIHVIASFVVGFDADGPETF